MVRPGIAPGTQYKWEIAGSIVNEYLGTNLVPPVAELTRKGEVGSAMLYQPGISLGGANRLRSFQAKRAEVDTKLAPLVPRAAIDNMWDRVETMLRTNKHGL